MALSSSFKGFNENTFKDRRERSGSRDMILTEAAKKHFHPVKLAYDGKRTVIRPLPNVAPDGNWSPFIVEDGGEYFVRYWLRELTIAEFVGSNFYSFCVFDPQGEFGDFRDENETPYRLCCTTSVAAAKANEVPEAWDNFIPKVDRNDKRDLVKASKLNWPRSFVWCQAGVYEEESKPLIDPYGLKGPDDPLGLVRLTYAAAESTVRLITTRGDFPDAIDFGQGAFLEYTQIGTGARRDGLQALFDTYSVTNKGNGYDLYVYDHLRDRAGDIWPNYDDATAAMLAAKIRPWDQVFHVASAEEQIGYLLAAGIPASLVVKACDDRYNHLIGADTRQAASRDLNWRDTQGRGFGDGQRGDDHQGHQRQAPAQAEQPPVVAHRGTPPARVATSPAPVGRPSPPPPTTGRPAPPAPGQTGRPTPPPPTTGGRPAPSPPPVSPPQATAGEEFYNQAPADAAEPPFEANQPGAPAGPPQGYGPPTGGHVAGSGPVNPAELVAKNRERLRASQQQQQHSGG